MTKARNSLSKSGALLVTLLWVHQAQAVDVDSPKPVPISELQVCGKVKLARLASYFADAPSIVVKRDGQDDLLLGQGLAQFSPDCKRFWLNASGRITVFTTADLGASDGVAGSDAAWLPDSRTIVFTKGESFELLTLDVETRRVETLFKPADSARCQQFGDGVTWTPVRATPTNLVAWTYPVKPAGHERELSDDKPAKTVYIDLRSRNTVRSEETRVFCTYYTPRAKPQRKAASR